MSDTPLASYEDTRLFPANANRVGNRGYSGVRATLTTNLANATNNDLVITAKNATYGTDPAILVQYAVLGNNAPGWIYDDGYPALFIPPTNLGFEIIMRQAGSWGDRYTLTLVNPGRPHALDIARPALTDTVITLAYASSAVTTTAALLVAAINKDPELSRYMIAFVSDSSIVTPVPAVATQAFRGGMDVPGLVLVSLANSNGTISATGTTTAALLNGSRYVSAVNAAANNGSGLVSAMAATALAGGTASRGALSEQYLTRRDAAAQRRRPGIPLGKETNRTLQVPDSRFGAVRSYQRVPRQDRAVIASSAYNYQTAEWPSHLLNPPVIVVPTTTTTTTTAAPTTTTTTTTAGP